MSEKSKKSSFSIILYIAASVVALLGVVLLVANVYLFSNAVKQYVAQGYPVAEVNRQLIPSQLLPGIFQPIAIYGGIALVLFGVGIANKKVSKCLTLLDKSNVCEDADKECILEQNVADINNAETIEHIETPEETTEETTEEINKD